MDGQILGGGVVLLVASVLWLVYLVPSWLSRHRFNTTERDAVRLSQALRVLAETSEAPAEVRLELDARTAYHQSRLARKAESERLQATKAMARDAAERERALEREQIAAERERARIEAELAQQRIREEAALEQERLRAIAAADRQRIARERAQMALVLASARRTQVRRRTRMIATLSGLAGVAGAIIGVLLIAQGATPVPFVAGIAVVLGSTLVLQRMATVARRARRTSARESAAEVAVRTSANPVVMVEDMPAAKWTPRRLPQPLSSVDGSVAAAAQDAVDAREQLRLAALEEAARQRAAELAPTRIETARPAAAVPHAGDDEAIEAHVRQLLEQRRKAG